MGASLKIIPLNRDILFKPGGALSPMQGARLVADFARGEIANADKTNADVLGKSVPHETFVNDLRSDALENVQPGKSIIATWRLGSDVVKFTYDLIVANSPVLTGKYKNSHRIFADGVEVDSPEATAGASEVVILSIVPYARKIEGAGKKPPQSTQAPDGVYQAAVTLARSRYGNVADIKYTMQSPVIASDLQDWAARHSAKHASAARRKRQMARDTRQPAIIITLR